MFPLDVLLVFDVVEVAFEFEEGEGGGRNGVGEGLGFLEFGF